METLMYEIYNLGRLFQYIWLDVEGRRLFGYAEHHINPTKVERSVIFMRTEPCKPRFRLEGFISTDAVISEYRNMI
jgi:hypothetical protein